MENGYHSTSHTGFSYTQMFFSRPSCLILKRDCLILVSSRYGICSSSKKTPYHTVVSGWEKLNLVRMGHLVVLKQIRATNVSYLILKFLSFKSAKGKINAYYWVSYKSENFLFKWELPTCSHPPTSAPLFWRRDQSRQLSFQWKILVLIGHHCTFQIFHTHLSKGTSDL